MEPTLTTFKCNRCNLVILSEDDGAVSCCAEFLCTACWVDELQIEARCPFADAEPHALKKRPGPNFTSASQDPDILRLDEERAKALDRNISYRGALEETEILKTQVDERQSALDVLRMAHAGFHTLILEGADAIQAMDKEIGEIRRHSDRIGYEADKAERRIEEKRAALDELKLQAAEVERKLAATASSSSQN
ncbi:hypothetical protein CC2G_004350 [Coprinopsis cinerea AmutBmut pab1-1]|nr:hypothetical protein CC2G_004350 [Coprinopsis cinerea AmutBmut pab1-1]